MMLKAQYVVITVQADMNYMISATTSNLINHCMCR